MTVHGGMGDGMSFLWSLEQHTYKYIILASTCVRKSYAHCACGTCPQAYRWQITFTWWWALVLRGREARSLSKQAAELALFPFMKHRTLALYRMGASIISFLRCVYVCVYIYICICIDLYFGVFPAASPRLVCGLVCGQVHGYSFLRKNTIFQRKKRPGAASLRLF